ncbi:hypothetical protein ACH5RR_020672 [Cinchona calisaya]|uniref:Uncharacterized protein n=1 Tax=Cinchona calisaya TaxID=153742 RepID=A0ABD2ZF83_9GENT
MAASGKDVRVNANKKSQIEEKNSDSKPPRRSRLVKNDVHAHSVRRRRSKEFMRDNETKEEEKSTVFSSTFNNVIVDKNALIEENPKEIREVEVNSVFGQAERSSSNGSPILRPGFRDKSEGGSRESSEEEDEHDREENNKPVQWNEDDQKNLMDLGNSEIDRNKRLESLIARRRSRKLLSLQVRRTLMNMDNIPNFSHITPLMVPGNNPSLATTPPWQFSPMPGSAPSVLIPMQNPFDIPYEPHEERPIVRGGSFDEEFMPLQQKDTLCRHESFSLGPFFRGELKQDRQETSRFCDSAMKHRDFEVHEDSEIESQLAQKDNDKTIEVGDHTCTQEDVQSPEQGLDLVDDSQEQETNEVKTKSMLSDDLCGKSSSASSSEAEEQFSTVDKDAILRFLSSSVARNISTNRDRRSNMEYDLNNCSPSRSYKNKMEERFFFADKAFRHSQTCSTASDLQVEVSEISSSPLTVDSSISSHDEEVPVYEGRMEGEITSSSEDISAAVSDRYGGVDESESRLRDIHEVSENYTIEVSSAKSSEDPVALYELYEKMIEEAPTPHTQLYAKVELPDGSHDHASVHRKAQQLPGEVMTQPSQNGVSKNPEKESFSSENTEREVKRTYNAGDSSVLQHNDAESFSIGDKDSGADAWIQEGGRGHAEWSLTSSPTYIGYTGDITDIMEDQEEVFAYYKAVGKNDNPRISGESINVSPHENLDVVMPVEEHDTPESNQDNEDEQTAEHGFPGVNNRNNGNPLSRLLPRLVVQQVPIASIISSSPRSVLQPKFSIDQSCLSNYNEEMHMDIQEFYTPMAESNILNEHRGESFTSIAPHTTTLFMEDPTSHVLHGRDPILQECSNPSTTSMEEDNLGGSGSEFTVHENERGQTALDDFPTTSTAEVNFTGSGSGYADHENEKGQNELIDFSGSIRESRSNPESAESQLKPMGESSSGMSKKNDEGSEEHNEHEAPNAFAKQTAQEPAKLPVRSSEVTRNPKKNELLVREMEKKSKDFLRNLMESFKD